MGTIATTVTITVDLQRPEINTIHAKQFDSLSRYADIKLLSDGQPWAAESSITYIIQYAKPDGTKGMYDKLPDGITDAVTAETDASGCTVLRARFAPQMLTVAGRVRFSIAMMKTDGTKLQTFSAILDVEPSEVNSYTSKDYYKITSLDELLEEVKKRVKSVNKILPNTNGDVYIRAESINTQVPSLNYLGSVEGALEALATMQSALPVASASSSDGIAYTATGDGLPTVQTGSHDTQTDPVGKGRQIVFIPYKQNASGAPTLQINGGEVIPIRMRAPRNQGYNDDIPDATQPIWIGALMRGVPYTLTFCGKYWLVDSQVTQFTGSVAAMLTKYAENLIGLSDGAGVKFPVVNVDDGVYGEIAMATVERTETETEAAEGNVKVPTTNKVLELIRKDVSAKFSAWTPEDGTAKTIANYAKTLPDGKYYIINGGTVYMDIFTVYGDVKYRFIRQYDDDACYMEFFRGDKLTISVEDDVASVMINGKRMLTDYNIPLPTAADVGKVLVASTQNCAAWTAVANAEEVAV